MFYLGGQGDPASMLPRGDNLGRSHPYLHFTTFQVS